MLTEDVPISANDTLAALIREAEAATEKMSADNPNRALLLRLCAYGLAVTQRCAALEQSAVELSEWRRRVRESAEMCRERGQSGKEHLYLTADELAWAGCESPRVELAY